MAELKVFLFFLAALSLCNHVKSQSPFPDSLLFGVATSAYQVEGAWNESDKGETIWDYMAHNSPQLVSDRGNGDIASDSFNHIDDDVEILKELGVDYYRFSISWARLLPTGFANKVSPTGMRYYHNLINALVDNDIMPMVTLYHWDLPNNLLKLGGWTNPHMAEYFEDYAQIVFENFGHKVPYWITFDEPARFCRGYGESDLPPVNLKMPGIGEYLCAHNVLKAHANTYHLYDDKYRARQKGSVGIALGVTRYVPKTTSTEDIAAMDRAQQFNIGLYANPIFTLYGDYPEEIIQAVDRRSSQEGFAHSRLSKFTESEVQYIKGTADFFGLTHFSSAMISSREAHDIGAPSYEKDIGVETWYDPSWGDSASSWLKVTPEAFTDILNWVSQYYRKPVIVTANGFSDHGELDDDKRVEYMQGYLRALRNAINGPANVIGFTAWSLMDNFEWLDGYQALFGLYHVNFTDPERPRTIKKSGKYYKKVIESKNWNVTVD